MKVIVYAISKNEEKFVKRWVNSMREADEIYVLDTGSTDQTVKRLKDEGVHVTSKIIKPWRFDKARNASLNLIKEEDAICVCTDLDEVFVKGWRKVLETVWQKNTTRLAYNYNWSLSKDKKPLVNFYIEKIHTKKDYQWTHPIHEVLSYVGKQQEVKITTDKITLNHFPDQKKSRSSYLPLLELSVKENPTDDRNVHYLGREYMYYGKWNEAIDILIHHLQLETSIWRDERCASMRFIGRCYQQLNRYEEAKMWLDKAMKESPHLRDPFMERALLAYNLEEFSDVITFTEKALKIKEHPKTYINEIFSWNQTPYDILSIAYFYTKSYDKALSACQKALKIDPDNKRLQNNLSLIKEKIETEK